jgi:NAD(P)-dependent dehydrogenase (short-subunit alcohol dehydrogenase family)
MSPQGKHALITGSSRGLGRGIALKLAEKGVKVAINYRQHEAAAEDTIMRIRERGSDGLIIQADVSRPEDVRRMFNEVRAAFGRLDIFVSNALGELFTYYRPPMDLTPEPWDKAVDCQAKAFLVGVQ